MKPNHNAVAFTDLDVPDPYDFPSDPDGLRQLDSALRCNICSELYEAPVSLPCGHTFCSLCIRHSIETSDKSVCAQCRKDVSLSQLRPVQAIEEVVVAWKIARSPVLQLLRDRESHDHDRDTVHASPSKKRRLNPVSENEDEAGPSTAPSGPKRAKSTGSSSSAPNTPDFVDCPVCSELVPMTLINQHLDNECKTPSSSTTTRAHGSGGDFPPSKPTSSKGSKLKSRADSGKGSKEQWNKLFESGGGGSARAKLQMETADPLPKATYRTLKDKQLKDLLARHDLPLTGGREIWISRHTQWVLLFNSNLDRSPSRRLSLEQLRTELRKWERQSGLLLDPAKKAGMLKVDVEDAAAYERAHRDQFAALVQAARATAKAKPKTKEEGANNTDTSTPPSSSEPELGPEMVLDCPPPTSTPPVPQTA